MPTPASTKYGINWPTSMSQVEIEIEMIRRGGRFVLGGKTVGEGLFHHYKALEMLLWPREKIWHRWNELQLREWLDHRTMAVIGPSSSGKSNAGSTDHLADYYCFPECTTILICSTTKERLQDRIFGEMKRYHRMARERFPWLPGNSIEGRMRIVTDGQDDSADGRDFRNGIIGVPCLQGGQFRGISEFIGIKNKRVRVVLDELQMLPPAVLLALSNLDKNEDFKASGYGNPKDTTDALGVFAEPSFTLGGWDGGVDQTPLTKKWDTRRPDGVCVQLVGSDSPNLDGKLGIPLITQAAIDRDIEQYGRESLQFSMMNQGMMPRGQGSRRVITRQFCQKHKALEQPVWLNGQRTKLASLDAAYKGVGGDRCVLMFWEFGFEAITDGSIDLGVNILSQKPTSQSHRQILHLIETMLVPIDASLPEESEEQIVTFVHTQCSTRQVPPENFFYDSGMRTSLVTAFGRMWSPMTNPIDCGGKPTDRPVGKITVKEQNGTERLKRCDEHYSKLITEFWFSVRLVIEAGQFRGLTESAMTEGCQREWKMVAGNKIEVETKREMKEKTGKSPDLFDDVALGVEGAKRLGFAVDNQALTATGKSDSKWKREFEERAKKQWASGALNHAA